MRSRYFDDTDHHITHVLLLSRCACLMAASRNIADDNGEFFFSFYLPTSRLRRRSVIPAGIDDPAAGCK